MNPIYLDNSTLASPSERAIHEMLPYFSEKWGSPAQPHLMGQKLFPALEESYRSIYALLGASEEDTIVLTSSGAEAVNHALFSGYFDVMLSTGKNHFVTVATDDAPFILSMGRLEKMGVVGKRIPVNEQGVITAEMVGDQITPRTAMVSFSWANGLTGVIQPVTEIAELCEERGIRLHIDATHVLGKLFYDLEDIGADVITFSGPPLHAPKGCGGIYLKNGIVSSPFILGGADQANLRGGPLDVPALVGMGVAAKEAMDSRDLLCTEVSRLRSLLEEKILLAYPEAVVFFSEQERLPHITCIGFPGVINEALLYSLSEKGVYASIGGGYTQQLALVLAASGIEDTLAETAVSFCLSRATTEEEVIRAAEIITETAKKLRKLSEGIYERQKEESNAS